MSLNTLANAIKIPFVLETIGTQERKDQETLARAFPLSTEFLDALIAYETRSSNATANLVNKSLQKYLNVTFASHPHRLITPLTTSKCTLANCRSLWSLKLIPASGGGPVAPGPAAPVTPVTPAAPVAPAASTTLVKGSVKFHSLKDLPKSFIIGKRGSTIEKSELEEAITSWLQQSGQGLLAKTITDKVCPNLHVEDVGVWNNIQDAVCAKLTEHCDLYAKNIAVKTSKTHTGKPDLFLQTWTALMVGYYDLSATRTQLARRLENIATNSQANMREVCDGIELLITEHEKVNIPVDAQKIIDIIVATVKTTPVYRTWYMTFLTAHRCRELDPANLTSILADLSLAVDTQTAMDGDFSQRKPEIYSKISNIPLNYPTHDVEDDGKASIKLARVKPAGKIQECFSWSKKGSCERDPCSFLHKDRKELGKDPQTCGWCKVPGHSTRNCFSRLRAKKLPRDELLKLLDDEGDIKLLLTTVTADHAQRDALVDGGATHSFEGDIRQCIPGTVRSEQTKIQIGDKSTHISNCVCEREIPCAPIDSFDTPMRSKVVVWDKIGNELIVSEPQLVEKGHIIVKSNQGMWVLKENKVRMRGYYSEKDKAHYLPMSEGSLHLLPHFYFKVKRVDDAAAVSTNPKGVTSPTRLSCDNHLRILKSYNEYNLASLFIPQSGPFETATLPFFPPDFWYFLCEKWGLIRPGSTRPPETISFFKACETLLSTEVVAQAQKHFGASTVATTANNLKPKPIEAKKITSTQVFSPKRETQEPSFLTSNQTREVISSPKPCEPVMHTNLAPRIQTPISTTNTTFSPTTTSPVIPRLSLDGKHELRGNGRWGYKLIPVTIPVTDHPALSQTLDPACPSESHVQDVVFQPTTKMIQTADLPIPTGCIAHSVPPKAVSWSPDVTIWEEIQVYRRGPPTPVVTTFYRSLKETEKHIARTISPPSNVKSFRAHVDEALHHKPNGDSVGEPSKSSQADTENSFSFAEVVPFHV